MYRKSGGFKKVIMRDNFGRKIDYIRISVTDRCNLRCSYCMPEEGIPVVSHQEILSFDEILRLTNIFAKLGISKIKITGGEPLVRLNIKELIREMKSVKGIEKVTITTNGLLLEEEIEGLVQAGIDSINLSLDTINPEIYKQITRRDAFEKVMRGFHKVLEFPEVSFKVNCVPMGLKEQNICEVANLAKKHNVHIRFIEIMPIGFGKEYEFMSEETILKELETRFGKYKRYNETIGNGPCHYYTFEGFLGKIGFISAVTHKFCDECNRVRLTAQGFLKTCLQYDIGCDLKSMLRSNSDDQILIDTIKETIEKKPKEHRFQEEMVDKGETLGMSYIGG